VQSNDGADYTHRVPKVEENFCSGFNCCGLELDDLHHLLEHFEECHVLPGGGVTEGNPVNPQAAATLAAAAAAAASTHANDGESVPEFDDFDEEQAAAAAAEAASLSVGTGPMLSAPPSPAMSSRSDVQSGSTTGTSVFDMANRRLASPGATFPNFTRKAKSRSPPSGGESNGNSPPGDDAGSVSAGGDAGNPEMVSLPFSRKMRQQSVDSLASVSTQGSTSSKKRSFGAAMGSNNNNPASGLPGGVLDLAAIRGHARTASGLSTPDSSHPGTPASELSQNQLDVLGQGCLPPSLLYPLRRAGEDEEMSTTDEDEEHYDDDDDEDDESRSSSQFDDSGLDDFEDDGNIPVPGMNPAAGALQYYTYQQMQNPAGGQQQQQQQMQMQVGSPDGQAPMPKRKKTGSSSVKRSKKYDHGADHAAAAMFSPLSLLGGNKHRKGSAASSSSIAVPGSVGAGHAPQNSQATASAATLAAIQAAAASSAFPDASTPTGRVWVPNNAKPFKCPVPGCDKAYKQQNGLKYHRLHGHCNANGKGEEIYEEPKEEDKPFGCYVGSACGKKYKNMNGLRYHYQHSGPHGQIGLQMLSNGTHPPPAYPPGHKRSANSKLSHEFASSGPSTVVMNQSTAEALLAAISVTGVSMNGPAQNQSGGNGTGGSRGNSRVGTPNMSRTASPAGRH